jgi:hypothetical protein
MSGFSTIVDGTTVSPLRVNYDITTNASQTYSALLTAKGITDKSGLLCVVYNNSAAAIDITMPIGNYLGYIPEATATYITIPPSQSATILTKTVSVSYELVAVSAKQNINAGAAGDLIYQTAANTTGYLAPSTPGYILESLGPGQPPLWNQLTTGVLSGGVAGSLDYQSAPSTTAKSPAGTQFTGNGGGMASQLTSTTAGWMQTNFLPAANGNTYTGGTLTLVGARNYSFSCTQFGGGSSVVFPTWLTTYNIPYVAGNRFAIYNNTSANFNLQINNVQNYQTFNSSFLTGPAAAQYIVLYPNETVILQQYNSTYFTIESTTQSQSMGGVWSLNVYQTNGYYTPTVIYDPNSWGTSGQTHFVPTKEGLYLFQGYLTWSNLSGQFEQSMTLLKNGTIVYIQQNSITGQTGSGNPAYQYAKASYIVPMNGSTDYLEIRSLYGSVATFSGGQCSLTLLN